MSGTEIVAEELVREAEKGLILLEGRGESVLLSREALSGSRRLRTRRTWSWCLMVECSWSPIMTVAPNGLEAPYFTNGR